MECNTSNKLVERLGCLKIIVFEQVIFKCLKHPKIPGLKKITGQAVLFIGQSNWLFDDNLRICTNYNLMFLVFKMLNMFQQNIKWYLLFKLFEQSVINRFCWKKKLTVAQQLELHFNHNSEMFYWWTILAQFNALQTIIKGWS